MDDPRFPIGKFHRPAVPLDAERRGAIIDTIAATPSRFREAVRGLSDAQLETPYRPGGWTVRQVAHHVADSHLNAYTRTRLALTEDEPTIKPYDEGKWAELHDAKSAPVEVSLTLLEAVHDRWVQLLRVLQPQDFERKLIHPENGPMTIDTLLALYAWHGPHHTAHVTSLRRREAW